MKDGFMLVLTSRCLECGCSVSALSVEALAQALDDHTTHGDWPEGPSLTVSWPAPVLQTGPQREWRH